MNLMGREVPSVLYYVICYIEIIKDRDSRERKCNGTEIHVLVNPERVPYRSPAFLFYSSFCNILVLVYCSVSFPYFLH